MAFEGGIGGKISFNSFSFDEGIGGKISFNSNSLEEVYTRPQPPTCP